MKHLTWCILSCILVASAMFSQQRPTPFQPDSASSYLRTLSIDIGPRPMGSPGEKAAMDFARSKFIEFGLDDAYVHRFTIAPSGRRPGANTQSGTAVGVLRGRTGRIIIIGAHIDSYSPEGPGANDDGSGSAVVMELARVMAQREWESTIVFCLFGGEESGLKGSYHFAETYSHLDSVALMLQVDMANGTDWLIPLYDLRTYSAPEWLVKASYEEFDRLGYSGLRYPTHFITLNSSMSGASSDHEPFLRKGIPAIDFTTDISDPIHTPQDSYDEFELGGLERSGDLVYRLTERFDDGVPTETTGSFMTVQIGHSVYLLPFWLLWVFIVLSCVVGAWSLVHLRPRRTEKRGETWVKIPGLKILLMTALVALVTVFFEDVVSLLSGYRSPWYDQPGMMIYVGTSVALLLFLLAGRFAPRLGLSNDEYRYALRANITLLVYIALAGLANTRLAIYPALGLFFVSLAFISRRGILAGTLVILGAYPMIRLMVSEVYDFMSRIFAQIPPGAAAVAAGVFLAVEGVIILTPFVLAFTGVVRSREKTWPRVPFSFAHPAWIGIAAIGIIVFTGMVISHPAYTERWTQKIDVVQEVSESGGDVRTTVKSADYLDGASIRFMALDTLITDHETIVLLPTLPFHGASWLRSEISNAPDRSGAVVSIHSWTRPFTLEVRYTTKGGRDRSNIVGASAGPYSIDVSDGAATMSFYSFPDTLLTIPVSLVLDKPDSVYQSVVATFVQPAVPMSVTKDNSAIVQRTIVRERQQFFVSRISEEAKKEDPE